jgi:hypothetical protein
MAGRRGKRMIEQIKQAVENREGSFDMRTEYLRYLIGEVERLKQSNSNLLKQYHQRGKDNDKVIYDLVSANTELQKALEWYADKKTYALGVNITMGSAFPLHEPIKSDKGERARTALKSIQGGETK